MLSTSYSGARLVLCDLPLRAGTSEHIVSAEASPIMRP
jgi:hypothetical protein